MAGVNTSIITDALRTQAVQGVVMSTFKNNEVLGRIPHRQFTGGATINVKHQYGTNSSVRRYSEGDAAPIAGAQSYLTAQWPCSYYEGTIQITGHARDQLRNGAPGAAFYDQIALEMEGLMRDLEDYVTQDVLGTGTTAPIGIQGIVDSTGTVAGVARATYSWFAAYETSNGTTVTLADINLAMRSSSDADYAAHVDQIWTSWKQRDKLQGATVLAGQANNSIRIESGGAINLSGVNDGFNIGGVPVIPIRDLDNSIFLGLTMSTFFLGIQRDWKVDALAKVDDSDKFLVTGAFGLGCDQPKANWKLTGYSA